MVSTQNSSPNASPTSLRALGPEALAALVARIAADRDRAAFKTLFAALGPCVKGMLMRQGADSAIAEDITQETFISLWRRAESFSPERGAVTTWLFTIARNHRIDRLRREAPWQELTDQQELAEAPEPRPDQALESLQIQSRVRAVLKTVPPEQAEVVRLAYGDGLSHNEIAARLGVPLGTVKTRMTLAYRKIRSALQDLR